MVLEIATGLAPLAMTEGDGGWSCFAWVRWLPRIVLRNGTEAVPYIGMHNTVGRAALPPPIRSR